MADQIACPRQIFMPSIELNYYRLQFYWKLDKIIEFSSEIMFNSDRR